MTHPVDIEVGRRLRQRRLELGLSQQLLADAMGISFQQLQKYELGSNRISASRLYDATRVLDVSANFFFDDMPAEVQAASKAKHYLESGQGQVAASRANSRRTGNLLDALTELSEDQRDAFSALIRAAAKANRTE